MKPLFDTTEALAPVGSKDWAIWCRKKMQASVDKDRQSEDQFHDYWTEFLENRGWEPLGFKNYQEFALCKRPDGLGMTKRQYLILCENAVQSREDEVADAKAKPLAARGGQEGNKNAIKVRITEAKADPLAKVGHKNEVDNVNFVFKGGNQTTYTLRRLARDYPELLDRIESGELSVNAAAIQAGIRKKPSQAEICVKAFRKCENKLVVFKVILDEMEPFEVAALRELCTERLS
jgi:hypothetical protein